MQIARIQMFFTTTASFLGWKAAALIFFFACHPAARFLPTAGLSGHVHLHADAWPWPKVGDCDPSAWWIRGEGREEQGEQSTCQNRQPRGAWEGRWPPGRARGHQGILQQDLSASPN